MSSIANHYDGLLADHYVWASGRSLEEQVDEQKLLLLTCGVGQQALEFAVDLGCGFGNQSIALAELGCGRILAVDVSRQMLDGLAAARGDLPIELVEADLLSLKALVEDQRPEVILCMGDTITHLNSHQAVSELIVAAHEILAPGGLFLLTFRDLTGEPDGTVRVIPLRAENDRIMTCVLSYRNETVVVTDLVYTRGVTSWDLQAGSYPKLRLAPAPLAEELQRAGFTIERNEPAGGLHLIAARRNTSADGRILQHAS